MTLQALREKVGDPASSASARLGAEHRYGNVTTAQFIALAERESGVSLRHFFDVWLYRDGRVGTADPSAAQRPAALASVPTTVAERRRRALPHRGKGVARARRLKVVLRANCPGLVSDSGSNPGQLRSPAPEPTAYSPTAADSFPSMMLFSARPEPRRPRHPRRAPRAGPRGVSLR